MYKPPETGDTEAVGNLIKDNTQARLKKQQKIIRKTEQKNRKYQPA